MGWLGNNMTLCSCRKRQDVKSHKHDGLVCCMKGLDEMVREYDLVLLSETAGRQEPQV